MGSMPRLARALVAVGGVCVAGQLLHATTGLGPTVLWEGWAPCVAALAGAALLLGGARVARHDALRWTILAVGLCWWGVASVVWWLAFDRSDASSVLFLPIYPCGVAFFALELRERVARLPTGVLLDMASSMLAVGAVGAATVLTRIPDATAEALLFPTFDLMLIAAVAALFTITRWSPGHDWLALGLSLLAFAAGDLIWALNNNAASPAVELCYAIAPLTMGLSPWLRSRPLPADSAVVAGRLLWPFVLFLAAFGVIVAGNFTAIPDLALGLAVASVLVTAYRGAQTFRAVRALPETRRQARTDELTGLTNRRAFFDAIERQVHRHPTREAAVLMLDLDRFKELNDTLGHAAGDRLLAELGPRLAGALRPADTLARLGGDEFAVLCPGASSLGARSVARRLQEALEAPFALGDLQVHVDASIGIATYPDDGATVEELLQRADVAMYQAKGDGTDIERYDAARDEHSRDRLELVGELRAALDAGTGLELHYQPQVCLHTEAILAVEALVRWRHPTRGVLAPAAFLPVAEGAGLMRRIGREVLRTAIAQAAAWHRAGAAVPVAVNLSTADLVDGALPTEIAQLLQAERLDGSWLKLEITENTVMTQPEHVTATLAELRTLGCRVSLDDFGTGHASLEHLVRLPVDELKIDRSFVLGLDRDEAGASAIVRALALLGRDLGVSVVAEGVETSRAWGQLVVAGCSSAQGYLLSRPLPAGELEAWLAARRGASSALEEQAV
jgi:diguanylate cyclase (GGDEF)-like protein